MSIGSAMSGSAENTQISRDAQNTAERRRNQTETADADAWDIDAEGEIEGIVDNVDARHPHRAIALQVDGAAFEPEAYVPVKAERPKILAAARRRGDLVADGGEEEPKRVFRSCDRESAIGPPSRSSRRP